MNDALLSGSVDFIAAGPPGLPHALGPHARFGSGAGRRGHDLAADVPEHDAPSTCSSLDDLTEADKIALTAVKVSIPAPRDADVRARALRRRRGHRFDRYTVTMTHRDGVVAMLSGAGGIDAHFTSPPFHRARDRRSVRSARDHDHGRRPGRRDDVHDAVDDGGLPAEQSQGLRAPCSPRSQEARTDHPQRPATPRPKPSCAEPTGAGSRTTSSLRVLQRPEIEFTTTPQNIMKYAEFMHAIGLASSIAPGSWKELFFPNIHRCAGQLTRLEPLDREPALTSMRRRAAAASCARRDAAVPHARAARDGDLPRRASTCCGRTGSSCSARRAAASRRCSRPSAGYLRAGRGRDPARGASHRRGPARTASWCSRSSISCCRGRPCARTSCSRSPPAASSGGARRRSARALHREGRPDGVRRQLSAHAVRRHEAARRHRTRHGHGARHPADGRALRRARRADPRARCRRSCCSCGTTRASRCCS